jgi:tetratricopeptide (TPR) repeat protein
MRRRGRAEPIMVELMETCGEHPVVRQNYAALLGRTNRYDEAIEIQKGTLALYPDYLPGRTTLVLAHVEAGEIEQADALVRGYELPERVHPSHYAAYLAAQAMLALGSAPPDTAAAERMLDMAQQIDPDTNMLGAARTVLAAITQHA